MMVGAGGSGWRCGTTGPEPGTQLPTETGRRTQRGMAVLSPLPKLHFSPYPVMCQSFLIPWEPAPAPGHIY